MPDFANRRTTMVDTQVRPSDVTKFPIIQAMLTIEREHFVPEDLAQAAYAGDLLDIGGRVMLDPRTFAKMLEVLNAGPSDMVLDIGCGLGYSAAVLAHMADTVVAVEDDGDRAQTAQQLLAEAGIDTAAVMEGPLADGAAKHGPYDAILIEGAIEMLPETLSEQLADGGSIVAIFQENGLGTVRLGRKSGSRITWRDMFNADAPLLPGFSRDKAFVF